MWGREKKGEWFPDAKGREGCNNHVREHEYMCIIYVTRA